MSPLLIFAFNSTNEMASANRCDTDNILQNINICKVILKMLTEPFEKKEFCIYRTPLFAEAIRKQQSEVSGKQPVFPPPCLLCLQDRCNCQPFFQLFVPGECDTE